MGYFQALRQELVGVEFELPHELTHRWPELGTLRYRRGGIPLRIGGWLLGNATVAAVTLGRTIFMARNTRLDAELLLHEFRHVEQFSDARSFPLRYIWQSLRRGYHANRYEVDARSYAASRLARSNRNSSEEGA